MIIRRERIYTKSKGSGVFVRTQIRKRESWWLLGIIPLYIRTTIVGGDLF